MIMSYPMITWCLIAGVLLCAFLFRAIERLYDICHGCGHRPKHLLEIGKEKDMFYIPGDFDEEDDFEDL